MSTLNHDLEQSWNYSKFSCPSGPSMRAADISVVAVEDERYFEVSVVATAGKQRLIFED